jgi:hypothetical protein
MRWQYVDWNASVEDRPLRLPRRAFFFWMPFLLLLLVWWSMPTLSETPDPLLVKLGGWLVGAWQWVVSWWH